MISYYLKKLLMFINEMKTVIWLKIIVWQHLRSMSGVIFLQVIRFTSDNFNNTFPELQSVIYVSYMKIR